jgi:large subunit ribosomal protein L4
MALAARIADNEVVLIDQLNFDVPKTREAAAILHNLGLNGMRLLVALDSYDATAYKSLRNIDKVETLPVSDINAYEVLRPKRVLMTRAALDMFRAKAAAVKA